MRWRAAGVMLSLVCAALSAACGGKGSDAATGPKAAASPAASYALSTVSNVSLPVTMYADTGYKLEVTAGTLVLSPGFAYTLTTTTKETFEGNVSIYIERSSGTWSLGTVSASAVTLTPSAGAAYSAVWSGDKLTVTQPDGTYLYSRTP